MKLSFILGTRPEAIKLAPVILAARRDSAFETFVVSTGQHRELLAPVLDFFAIKPDHELAVLQPDQTLDALTARTLVRIGESLDQIRPDAVMVQGDTTTAMTGAMAAFYRRIAVAHLEAGLRTNDLLSPFPEEFNRRVVGQVARWHFAPTHRAAQALRAEALPPSAMRDARVLVTGNTVIDALFLALEILERNPPQHPVLARVAQWKTAAANRRLVVVTGHRRENFGAPFEEFCRGLLDIAAAHPQALLVYPVHLNPNVQRPVRELLSAAANIVLCDPMGYPEFVALMRGADLIVTDSGGVQEEAPALGIPVLVTRTTTERPEAVEAGSVELVGPDRAKLFTAADKILKAPRAAAVGTRRASPYGDGAATGRCLAALLGKGVGDWGG